jgi:putative membrane protein
MLLGVVLAFATTAFYSYYTAVPRLWGIDVVTDQRIGGLIMWVPGSMMFIVAALIMVFRLFGKEKERSLRTQVTYQTHTDVDPTPTHLESNG